MGGRRPGNDKAEVVVVLLKMARYSHLPIFQKSYDLFKFLHQYVATFPRSEKYSLGQKIKDTNINFLDQIIRANNAKNKRLYLEEARQLLEILRIYLRLCYDLKLMGIKRYEIVSQKIDEIGRMLGGWLKNNV